MGKNKTRREKSKIQSQNSSNSSESQNNQRYSSNSQSEEQIQRHNKKTIKLKKRKQKQQSRKSKGHKKQKHKKVKKQNQSQQDDRIDIHKQDERTAKKRASQNQQSQEQSRQQQESDLVSNQDDSSLISQADQLQQDQQQDNVSSISGVSQVQKRTKSKVKKQQSTLLHTEKDPFVQRLQISENIRQTNTVKILSNRNEASGQSDEYLNILKKILQSVSNIQKIFMSNLNKGLSKSNQESSLPQVKKQIPEGAQSVSYSMQQTKKVQSSEPIKSYSNPKNEVKNQGDKQDERRIKMKKRKSQKDSSSRIIIE